MQEPHDYSLVGPSSRHAVETGLAQADWYKPDVPRKRMKELMRRRDGPAIRDTILWIGSMVLFAGLGVYLWFSWWSVLCFLAYGVLYGSGADARWHEAGHGTAFRTRWMNTALYQLACFMMMRNPTTWRWSHVRHHTDTIIVGRDAEILAKRPPNLFLLSANLVGLVDVPLSVRAMGRHTIGRLSPEEADFTPASEFPKVFRVARIWIVIYALTIAACIVFRSILPLIVVGLPRLYGAWHHVLTGLTQHAGLAEDVTDHRLNTRTMYLNPISRFLYWNMNYHIEHHMFPMVPFHQLPDLHEEIRDDLPEPSPSMTAAIGEFMPVLLRQQQDPDYFIDRSASLPAS